MQKYLWKAAGLLILLAFIVLSYMAISRHGLSPAEQGLLQQSASAFNKNDLTGALQKSEAVLAENPRSVAALVSKATALAQKGSLEFKEKEYGEQAILVAREALAIDPQSDEAWRIIGYSYEIIQDYVAAHDAYARAIGLNPKNVAAISEDAHASDLEGNIAQAEAGYRRALSLDLTFDQANMGLGRILVQQGKLAEARTHFEMAAQMSNNARMKAEGAYSAGVVSNALADPIKAESSMRLAIATAPSYALGWVGLGTVLFSQAIATSSSISLDERNDLVSASFSALTKARSMNPNQSLAVYQIGFQLGALGRTQEAVKVLTETKKIIPNDITLNAPDKAAFLARIDAAILLIQKAAAQ